MCKMGLYYAYVQNGWVFAYTSQNGWYFAWAYDVDYFETWIMRHFLYNLYNSELIKGITLISYNMFITLICNDLVWFWIFKNCYLLQVTKRLNICVLCKMVEFVDIYIYIHTYIISVHCSPAQFSLRSANLWFNIHSTAWYTASAATL